MQTVTVVHDCPKRNTTGLNIRQRSRRGISRTYCIDVRNASAAAILCDEKLTILTKE